MENFVKGDVVILPFPFSDLSGSKRRPALVLAKLLGDDIILCQITSQQIKDSYAVTLGNNDFDKGSLPVESNIRPNRIFTADKNIIIKKAGSISNIKLQNVIDVVHSIIR